jgi:hypothetical protein
MWETKEPTMLFRLLQNEHILVHCVFDQCTQSLSEQFIRCVNMIDNALTYVISDVKVQYEIDSCY